jgi:hypothetical protein
MAVPYYSEGNTDRNPPSQHPISPPQELRDKWRKEAPWDYRDYIQLSDYLIAQAAQWAWDQREPEIQARVDAELEACCEWLNYNHPSVSTCHLREARRPKPLSWKERLLKAISDGEKIEALKLLEALPDV